MIRLLSVLLALFAAPATAIDRTGGGGYTCRWMLDGTAPHAQFVYGLGATSGSEPGCNAAGFYQAAVYGSVYNTNGPINFDDVAQQIIPFQPVTSQYFTGFLPGGSDPPIPPSLLLSQNNGYTWSFFLHQTSSLTTGTKLFQPTRTTCCGTIGGVYQCGVGSGATNGPYADISVTSNKQLQVLVNYACFWMQSSNEPQDPHNALVTSDAAYVEGGHLHVVLSCNQDGDTATLSMYVWAFDTNGFLAATSQNSAPGVVTDNTNKYTSGVTTSGANFCGIPNSVLISGNFDDVIVYNHPMNYTEASQIYPFAGMNDPENLCGVHSGACSGNQCVVTYPTWDWACNGCANLKYGSHCNATCPINCAVCNQVNTFNRNNYQCSSCLAGFYGKATGCTGVCPSSCVPDQCVDVISNGTATFQCNTCQQGYFGPQCQYTCATSNCVSGACRSDPVNPSSFTCGGSCLTGWVGPACTTQCTGQSDPSNCAYNATLNDFYYVNSPATCRTGYVGPKCNIVCSPLCGGASNCGVTTVSGVLTYLCRAGCPSVPWWGGQCQNPTCQTNEDPTRLNWQVGLTTNFISTPPQVGYTTTTCSCYNNSYDAVYGQLVQWGVSGATCSNYCTPAQGTITRNVTSGRYYCSCNPGYTGTSCQIKLCTSYADVVHGVCLNGGTCSDNNATVNAYCVCPSGWVGNTTCSIKVGLDIPVGIQTQMVFRYPMTQTPIIDVVSNKVLTTLNNQLALAWYTTPNMGNVFGLNMLNASSNVNTSTPTGSLSQFTMTAWIQPHTALPSDYLYTPLVTKSGFGAIGIQRVAGVTLTPYCSVGATTIGVSSGLPAMGINQMVFVACAYNTTHLTLTALYYDTNGYLAIPTATVVKAVSGSPTVSTFQFQYSTLNTFVTDVALFPTALSNATITSMYPAIAYTYNPCSVNTTCQNGASCTALGGNGFTCGCAPGFNGTNCQNKLCSAFSGGNPCLHGALCNDNHGTSNFVCGCAAPYEGPFCDRCSITTNTNGNCMCQNSTFSVSSGVGPLTSLTDSCSLSCTNGAVTKLPNNTYYCACNPGYSPPDCAAPIDYCNTNLYAEPCQNGGTCSFTGPGKFNCTCPGGVTGPACTTQLNYCNATQFNQVFVCGAHGTCINDGGGNYHCNCTGIYTGADCSQVKNPCVTVPCANNGACTPHSDATYNCNCTNAWYGTNCDQWNNPCAASPCQHGGNCYSTPGLSSYTCLCNGGWTGPTCTAQTCALYGTCQHGGTCVDGQGLQQASCKCAGAWTGTNCTTCGSSINTVASNCSCVAGSFSVRSAQGPLFDLADNCNNQCVHGSVQLDPYLHYYCACNAGWQGTQCSQWIDPCASVTCLHGGKCNSIQGQTGFNCSCKPGWNGTLCDIGACAPAPGAVINTTTCACTGNNYHPTYGQTSQLGVINATCPAQCVSGQVTQGQFNNTFSCVCPPGFTGAACATWQDPCGLGVTAACGGSNYVCSSAFGDTEPTCTPYAAAPSFFQTYIAYLGGFGGTSVAGLAGIFLWDKLYADGGSPRILPTRIGAPVSATACIQAARTAGWLFAGIEVDGECWIGNDPTMLTYYGSSNVCSVPCNPANNYVCGGNWAITVYMLIYPTQLLPTARYLGCYADLGDGTRAMTSFLFDGGNITQCLSGALTQRYPYAGTQNGAQCWLDGANTYDKFGLSNACTMPCPDGQSLCGGPSANGVYGLTTSTLLQPSATGVVSYYVFNSGTPALLLPGTNYGNIQACFSTALTGASTYTYVAYTTNSRLCYATNNLNDFARYGSTVLTNGSSADLFAVQPVIYGVPTPQSVQFPLPFENNGFIPFVANTWPVFSYFTKGNWSDTIGFTKASINTPIRGPLLVQFPGPLGQVQPVEFRPGDRVLVKNFPGTGLFTISFWGIFDTIVAAQAQQSPHCIFQTGPQTNQNSNAFALYLYQNQLIFMTGTASSVIFNPVTGYFDTWNSASRSSQTFWKVNPLVLTGGPTQFVFTFDGLHFAMYTLKYSVSTGYLISATQLPMTQPASSVAVSLQDIQFGPFVTTQYIWDLYMWNYAMSAGMVKNGIYNNPAMYGADPCVAGPVSPYCVTGSCRGITAPGFNTINASYTCNANCLVGWAGDQCTTQVCFTSADASILDRPSCMCKAPYYNTVYGRDSQMGVVVGAGATCNATCPSTSFIYQNPFTLQWSCVAGVQGQNPGPCANGATYYQNSDGSYYCACVGIWGGKNCTVNTWSYNACDSNLYTNPCANNGQCKSTGNGTYSCDCTNTGYAGSQCQTPIDMCSSGGVACGLKGACVTQGPGLYSCQCNVGWGGVLCDQKVDYCSVSDFNPLGAQICNYGTCSNSDPPGQMTCNCGTSGYKGTLCNTPINTCVDSAIYPCSNGGVCVSTGPATYTCQCPRTADNTTALYIGAACETPLNKCNGTQYALNPCQHGANCTYTGPATYSCLPCPTGFSGTNCDQVIDYCSPNPCQNNGICTSLPSQGTYSCNCGYGNFFGRNCTNVYDICAQNPCLRGACQLTATGYTCVCPVGLYNGTFCETYIGNIVPVVTPAPTVAPTTLPPASTLPPAPTPVPTTPPDPNTYTLVAGDYQVQATLAISYTLIFANLDNAKLQLQQDLAASLQLPTTRSAIVNIAPSGDNTRVTIDIKASASPSDKTPLFYWTLLQTQLADSTSAVYQTQLLYLTTSAVLAVPSPNSPTISSLTEALNAAASPLIIGSLAAGSVGVIVLAFLLKHYALPSYQRRKGAAKSRAAKRA